jgi:hypothetical protein
MDIYTVIIAGLFSSSHRSETLDELLRRIMTVARCTSESEFLGGFSHSTVKRVRMCIQYRCHFENVL